MSTSTMWRNRIVGTGEEAPDQLLASPDNWRVHPKEQQDALAAVLDDLGFIQTVIVNKRTSHVIDGHLRVALAISRQEPTIPVSYVDLSPDEERRAIALFDPIAAMAVTDRAALTALTNCIAIDHDVLKELLGKLTAEPETAVNFNVPSDLPVCESCGQKIRKKKTRES